MKTFTDLKKEVASGKNAWDAINEANLSDTGLRAALMNAIYYAIEIENELADLKKEREVFEDDMRAEADMIARDEQQEIYHNLTINGEGDE